MAASGKSTPNPYHRTEEFVRLFNQQYRVRAAALRGMNIQMLFIQKVNGFEVVLLYIDSVERIHYTQGNPTLTINRTVLSQGISPSFSKIFAHSNGNGLVIVAPGHSIIYFLAYNNTASTLSPIARLTDAQQLTVFPKSGLLLWIREDWKLMLGDFSSGALVETPLPVTLPKEAYDKARIYPLSGTQALCIIDEPRDDKQAWLLDINPHDIKSSQCIKLKKLSRLLSSLVKNNYRSTFIVNASLSPDGKILAILYEKARGGWQPRQAPPPYSLLLFQRFDDHFEYVTPLASREDYYNYLKWTSDNKLLVYFSDSDNEKFHHILAAFNPANSHITSIEVEKDYFSRISTVLTEGEAGSILMLNDNGKLQHYIPPHMPDLFSESISALPTQLSSALGTTIPSDLIRLMVSYLGNAYTNFPLFLKSKALAATFQPPERLNSASQEAMKHLHAKLQYTLATDDSAKIKTQLAELEAIAAELTTHPEKSVQECIVAVYKKPIPTGISNLFNDLTRLYSKLQDAPNFEEDEAVEVEIIKIAPATYPVELQKRMNLFFTQLNCDIRLSAKPDPTKIKQRDFLLTFAAEQAIHYDWSTEECLQKLFKQAKFKDIQKSPAEFVALLTEMMLYKAEQQIVEVEEKEEAKYPDTNNASTATNRYHLSNTAANAAARCAAAEKSSIPEITLAKNTPAEIIAAIQKLTRDFKTIYDQTPVAAAAHSRGIIEELHEQLGIFLPKLNTIVGKLTENNIAEILREMRKSITELSDEFKTAAADRTLSDSDQAFYSLYDGALIEAQKIINTILGDQPAPVRGLD